MNPKARVLFVCTENAARSQMAEALLKHEAAQRFDAFSAGTLPSEVKPGTWRALIPLGIEPGSLRAKNIDEFVGESFDYVITLCSQANQECSHLRGLAKRLEWDIPDPDSLNTPHAYEQVFNEIAARITSFIHLEASDDVHSQTGDFEQPIDVRQLFKIMSDPTRLLCLLLIHYEGELCVCELIAAIEDIQPKISRHLALLRKSGLLVDRKEKQWVFYRINPALPQWVKNIISETASHQRSLIKPGIDALAKMGDRPARRSYCNTQVTRTSPESLLGHDAIGTEHEH